MHLLETLNFSALGICISNRKNMPAMKEKLQRGQCVFRSTNNGLLCTKRQDPKEIIVSSNCHGPKIATITKKTKTGERQTIQIPEAISFYRQKMGGVDRADQFVGLYDHDRKSNKWWKKVFYTCLNMCGANAWIIYNDLRPENKKVPFLTFLVTFAKELTAEGIQITSLPPPRSGPQSKKMKLYERLLCTYQSRGPQDEDVIRYSQEKWQTRTKTLCQECNIPVY